MDDCRKEFDEHWEKVVSFNPNLPVFVRPIAEAACQSAWNRRASQSGIEQPSQSVTSDPVAWMSANQKSFVHNLDIGDSVPNWTDYYTIPLYAAPQPCSRCAEICESCESQVMNSDNIIIADLQTKLAAIEAENKRLKELSVENILIEMSPGWDGMGQEIYAKSVSDVEKLLSKMSEKAETGEATIAALEAENALLKGDLDLGATIAQQAEEIKSVRTSWAKSAENVQRLRQRNDDLVAVTTPENKALISEVEILRQSCKQQAETIQRQAAVIEKCRYALDHYMYGGSNYRKPAEEALAAIKSLKETQ